MGRDEPEKRPEQKGKGSFLVLQNRIDTSNISGAAAASGLRPEDATLMRRMAEEYAYRLDGNAEKLKYYNDEVDGRRLDRRIPPDIASMNVSPGWCAKAVNMLARRSILDGVTVYGESAEIVERIMRDNRISENYAMATPSQLIFGCGFWTVSPGKDGEPDAVVNYHDLTESCALWDYRKNRIKCGFVIEDAEQVKPDSSLVPTVIVMHTHESIIELSSADGVKWKAEYKPHVMGRPLMVPMRFNPTKAQPFGKSRVSSACRSLTRQMILETQNLIVHAQASATPQKVIAGLSDAQFDALSDNIGKAYAADMLLLTNNEDGGTPAYTSHGLSGASEHTQIIKSLAERFAAETDLPLSAFGVIGNTYTSENALRASSDDLIILAESMNAMNGACLAEVAKMALLVATGRSYSDLTEEEKALTIHWRDPSMPSIASLSDAMLKQAAIVDWLKDTTIFWEKLGYSEEQRMRLMSERGAAERSSAMRAVLLNGVKDGGSENSAKAALYGANPS